MFKALRTRYHGPTDTLGSRVIASDSDNNRVVLSWAPELNSDDNHKRAAYALRDKMGWKGDLVPGDFGRDTFWVFTS